MARSPARKLLLTALVALALGAVLWAAFGPRAQGPGGKQAPPLALFTSLPLYWSESADISGLLTADGDKHWVRTLIEERRAITPVDVFTPEVLKPFGDLLIAQPRALAPAENVVLDAWVRRGGHLLLFADPMLTQPSAFAVGDKRRPMDTVLLSPILAHWGLELLFDEGQLAGETTRDAMGLPVAVNQAGRFATRGQANCELWSEGLMVTCRIGKGRVVAFADAALLERENSRDDARKALGSLLDTAFAAH